MAVAGICHSDDHFATGDMVPTPELAAIMESTGAPHVPQRPLEARRTHHPPLPARSDQRRHHRQREGRNIRGIIEFD
jgi:hypothetical protein